MNEKIEKTKRTRENIHVNHRSRVKNKFVNIGLDSFCEHEVLELLLFYSIPQADTNPLAHKLIEHFGSLDKVFDASIDSLLDVGGIGENTAILIKLVPAIMNQYSKYSSIHSVVIRNQIQAMAYINKLMENSQKEEFYVLTLDASGNLVSKKQMGSGDASKVEIAIRDITNYCIKNDADRIIIAHNHPKSNCTPSNDDIVMTSKLFNSCVLNDIDILDHIIYSKEGTYSFAEEKLMDKIKMEILDMLKFTIDKTKWNRFSTSVREYVVKKEN